MPYIKMEERMPQFDAVAINSGQLNYQITRILQRYLEQEFSYARINDVLGALEGAKLEFYRRVVVPYENKKIEQNGDVYNRNLL